jgi:hypothetical protein
MRFKVGEKVWVRFFGWARVLKLFPDSSHPYSVWTESDCYTIRVVDKEVYDKPTEQDENIGTLGRSMGKIALFMHGDVYRDPEVVLSENEN